MIMWLFLVLVCAFSDISLLQCTPIDDHTIEELRENNIYIENEDSPRTCTDLDFAMWSPAFDACFITRKIGGVGWNLANTVDRILQHAGDCLDMSQLSCRPNYSGFQRMMGKVINELQDYSTSFGIEMNFQGKKTMKDLDCVEAVLAIQTYAKCFKPMFDSFLLPGNFFRKVENAISCTNERNKLCSNDAKANVNRMVRTILGVKQPAEENFEANVETTTPHSSASSSSSPPSPTLHPHHHSTETPLPPRTSTSLPNSSPPSSNQHHFSTKTPLSRTPSTVPPTSSSLPPTSSSLTPTSSPLPKPSSSIPPPLHHHHYTTEATLPPRPAVRHHHYTTEAPLHPRPAVRHQHYTTTSPPPPTNRWYDYILDPIVSAWNWFTSLFG